MNVQNSTLAAQSAQEFREDFGRLIYEIGKIVVGYQEVVELVLVGLFSGGHLLLEGLPGLGKTILVRTLADALDVQFSRIQFTPDLMPADILGTNLIVDVESGKRAFQFHKGPIFAHLILADEINRATPKTQSALLECMQEKTITVAGTRYCLEEPFCVLATQNPIEMQGTYPLPEAQLDRFFFKLSIPYPSRENLNQILLRTTENAIATPDKVLNVSRLQKWMRWVREVYIAPPVQDYAARLVLATHPDTAYAVPDVQRYIRYGASPRGAQALVLAGKIKALLQGRYNVSWEDIAGFAKPALRHRILLQLEAEAQGITSDTVVEQIVQQVPHTLDQR
jgi:MoxR-like ATPase